MSLGVSDDRDGRRLSRPISSSVVATKKTVPPSQHVPIVRRHVAKLGLLPFGQSDVVVLLSPAILDGARQEVHDAGHRAQADEGQTDAVALVEEGLGVGRLEAVTGNDAEKARGQYASPNIRD